MVGKMIHALRTVCVSAAASAFAVAAAADINRTFVYNGADQLVEVREGGVTVATHGYDGDGERISKTVGAEEVIYVRGPSGQVLAEYEGDGDLIAEYVYLNGQKVARIAADGATTYYHTDHLGTPRAITDASGQVAWHGDNLPFGEEYGSTGGRDDAYTFTGHEHDAPIELIYAHARYYDPGVGRFITTDPVGGDPTNPQSWNRYVYVRNNPLNLLDSTGMIEDAYLDRQYWVDLGGAPRGQISSADWLGISCVALSSLGPAAGVGALVLPEVITAYLVTGAPMIAASATRLGMQPLPATTGVLVARELQELGHSIPDEPVVARSGELHATDVSEQPLGASGNSLRESKMVIERNEGSAVLRTMPLPASDGSVGNSVNSAEATRFITIGSAY